MERNSLGECESEMTRVLSKLDPREECQHLARAGGGPRAKGRSVQTPSFHISNAVFAYPSTILLLHSQLTLKKVISRILHLHGSVSSHEDWLVVFGAGKNFQSFNPILPFDRGGETRAPEICSDIPGSGLESGLKAGSPGSQARACTVVQVLKAPSPP